MKNSWTTPKVKSFPLESGKEWYVWFRFNGILKIVKTGINKIPNYEERLEEANALASVLNDRLHKGWNPVNKQTVVAKEILSFNKALDFALEKKRPNIAEKTYLDYRCTVRFFKKAAKKLKLNSLNIADCERHHIKLILEDLQQEHSWTNKNHNKHLGYIKSIFSELVEWEEIKFNIVRDIRTKKELKTEGYIQPTDQQQEKIFEYLKKIDYNFYVFCSVEYYLGIRPKEILSLKCGDINLASRSIRLSAGNTKDASYRYVPILDNVFVLLEKLNLTELQNYVFGSRRPEGGISKRKDYFSPNPYQIKRDTATRKWKLYIIDGLGINVKCYSLKHKGANDKLKAGMDLKTISEMFGHSEEKITEIYANYMNKLRFEKAREIKLKSFG